MLVAMAKNESLRGEPEIIPPFPKTVQLSEQEHIALKAVLHRDWTSRQSHGGLRQLLSLSHGEYLSLMDFLNRV